MGVVYLTQQGSTVRRHGDTLVVESDGRTLADLEVHGLDALCILGRVHLTLQAMELLLRREVPTAFFTMDGRLKGRLVPPAPHNVSLRLEQFRRAESPATRLAMARLFVRAKLENARELVHRFQYNHPETAFPEELGSLRDAVEASASAESLECLRGVEGAGTRAYFTAMSRMCRGDLPFAGRSAHPPKDPFNAILSLGYMFLVNEISHLAEAIGLDPYIGFYHDSQDRRASLALDLIEELRHPVIDRFCLHLNNNRVLEQGDFRPADEGSEGVRLTDEAFRRFLMQYGHWMVRSPRDLRPSPREIVRRQVERLADSLRTGRDYEPYRFEA